MKKNKEFISPQENIREFWAYTESDWISHLSKEKSFWFNIKDGKVVLRDKRVDSFFSKKIKPLDLLEGIDKNIDLENLDNEVVENIKTPIKKQHLEIPNEPFDFTESEVDEENSVKEQ